MTTRVNNNASIPPSKNRLNTTTNKIPIQITTANVANIKLKNQPFGRFQSQCLHNPKIATEKAIKTFAL
jgi:hypothetical protein